MRLQKWNPRNHTYQPFDSPAKKTTLFTNEMETKVDCANCGKEILFGDSYTSKMIHTEHGFGYPVCFDCYFVEKED